MMTGCCKCQQYSDALTKIKAKNKIICHRSYSHIDCTYYIVCLINNDNIFILLSAISNKMPKALYKTALWANINNNNNNNNNNNTLYLYTKHPKYKLCSVVLTTLKHYKKEI